ncbi:hypothetical protein PR048_000306 [Dryococelus australis]|uniref:Uncharacterized protein n=1 Tax=Dryococelus australis TaxID=614101 RepID=A0ABQ9IEV3_9NEOP|nr:hypothetical protein PR048_000306 [Dryococelus australis]
MGKSQWWVKHRKERRDVRAVLVKLSSSIVMVLPYSCYRRLKTGCSVVPQLQTDEDKLSLYLEQHNRIHPSVSFTMGSYNLLKFVVGKRSDIKLGHCLLRTTLTPNVTSLPVGTPLTEAVSDILSENPNLTKSLGGNRNENGNERLKNGKYGMELLKKGSQKNRNVRRKGLHGLGDGCSNTGALDRPCATWVGGRMHGREVCVIVMTKVEKLEECTSSWIVELCQRADSHLGSLLSFTSSCFALFLRSRFVQYSVCYEHGAGGGGREIPEKPRRPTASSGTIPTCENSRLVCSPPTKANRVQSPAGSLPDFCKWESRRTMSLLSGFCRGSPLISPLIGSQDPDIKSHPNIFTHSLAIHNRCPLTTLLPKSHSPDAHDTKANINEIQDRSSFRRMGFTSDVQSIHRPLVCGWMPQNHLTNCSNRGKKFRLHLCNPDTIMETKRVAGVRIFTDGVPLGMLLASAFSAKWNEPFKKIVTTWKRRLLSPYLLCDTSQETASGHNARVLGPCVIVSQCSAGCRNGTRLLRRCVKSSYLHAATPHEPRCGRAVTPLHNSDQRVSHSLKSMPRE